MATKLDQAIVRVAIAAGTRDRSAMDRAAAEIAPGLPAKDLAKLPARWFPTVSAAKSGAPELKDQWAYLWFEALTELLKDEEERVRRAPVCRGVAAQVRVRHRQLQDLHDRELGVASAQSIITCQFVSRIPTATKLVRRCLSWSAKASQNVRVDAQTSIATILEFPTTRSRGPWVASARTPVHCR